MDHTDWRANSTLTAITTQLRKVKPSFTPSMTVRIPMTAKAMRNNQALERFKFPSSV